MEKEKVNHLAVFILAVFHQVLGAIWYCPAIFGNLWLMHVGKDMETLKATGNQPYLVAFLSSYTLCYFLVWVINRANASTAIEGIRIGFLIWCGAAVPISAPHYAFPARSAELFFIDMGHSLVLLVIAGAVLAVWRKK